MFPAPTAKAATTQSLRLESTRSRVRLQTLPMLELLLLTPQLARLKKVKLALDSGSGLSPRKITVPQLSRPTLSAEQEHSLSSLLHAHSGSVLTRTAVYVTERRRRVLQISSPAGSELLLHRALRDSIPSFEH